MSLGKYIFVLDFSLIYFLEELEMSHFFIIVCDVSVEGFIAFVQ